MNSCRKGKVGEREFAELLRAHGWDARRSRQFKGTSDSADIHSNNPIAFEVKRVEKFTPKILQEWVLRARQEAENTRLTAVAHRPNGGEWLITFLATDFLSYQNKKELRAGAKGNSNETNAPLETPAVPNPNMEDNKQ